MDFDKGKFAALPKPQPGRESRRKLVVMAAMALILLVSMVFWVTRDEGAKQDIVAQTKGALQSAGLDPLVNATKEFLGPLGPPPLPPLGSPSAPEHSVGVAAPGIPASGTLIQGTVPDLAALSGPTSTQASEKATENPEVSVESAPPPGVMPQQREDSVIRPDFVQDLARWLVARYKPAPGGKGQLNASLQAANMRYGMNMRGMESQGKDPAGARAHILRYAFNPAMLEALYGVYAERLVEEVARTALAPDQGKALSEAQLDDLYKAYAAFFADLSGVVGGIAAMPDLKERIETINRANQQTVALHRQLAENVFALDEARDAKNEAGIPGIEARIENLNGRYRASLQGQNSARAALVSAIRNSGQGKAQFLDDESVLFLALWIERRMDKQTDALDAVYKASALLTDLARLFEKAGDSSRKLAGTR